MIGKKNEKNIYNRWHLDMKKCVLEPSYYIKSKILSLVNCSNIIQSSVNSDNFNDSVFSA